MSVCLVVAVILFIIGLLTVLIRKNLIVIILGLEMCLNAVNLSLVAFSKLNGDVLGQSLVIFVIIISASEVVVGLVLTLLLYKNNKSLNIDLVRRLKN